MFILQAVSIMNLSFGFYAVTHLKDVANNVFENAQLLAGPVILIVMAFLVIGMTILVVTETFLKNLVPQNKEFTFQVTVSNNI